MLTVTAAAAIASRAAVEPHAGVELCMALWTVHAPEREPMAARSRAIWAAMPAATRDAAVDLGRDHPRWPLDAAAAMLRRPEPVDAALARLADEDPDVLADELFPLPGSGPAIVPGPRLSAARRAEGAITVVRVLRAFVLAGYGRYRDETRCALGRAADAMQLRLAERPLSALTALSPRIRHDADADRLAVHVGHDAEATVDGHGLGLRIVPSLWLRRRVVVLRDTDALALVVRGGPPLRAELDPQRMVDLCSALSDARRAEIVRRCLQRPHDTSELAVILGLTAAPVSRHLKLLERHGIVAPRREGRHVRYVTVIEVLHLLGHLIQRLPHPVEAVGPGPTPSAP